MNKYAILLFFIFTNNGIAQNAIEENLSNPYYGVDFKVVSPQTSSSLILLGEMVMDDIVEFGAKLTSAGYGADYEYLKGAVSYWKGSKDCGSLGQYVNISADNERITLAINTFRQLKAFRPCAFEKGKSLYARSIISDMKNKGHTPSDIADNYCYEYQLTTQRGTRINTQNYFTIIRVGIKIDNETEFETATIVIYRK